MSDIHSISPIDGRYQRVTKELQSYFSEAALIQYRIRVEVQYLLALSEESLKGLDRDTLKKAVDALIPWSEHLNG
jgi:adenylosuccinate lyase